MSLLKKLGLQPVPPATTAPATAAAPTAAPAKRPKTAILGPDANDGRRTRLDLDDEDDEATPAAPTVAADPTLSPARSGAAAPGASSTGPTTSPANQPATDTPTAADPGPRTMRVDIVNNSGFPLRRSGFVTEDAATTSYDAKPADSIDAKGFTTVVAKATGDDPNVPAGNVDYYILVGGSPGGPLARMSWRRGASPVGTVTPNDGRFAVRAVRKSEDRFQYVIESHQGPAPEPEAPIRITIDNRSGATLMLDKSGVDNAKSAFAPAPPSTIDGGQKAQFAVASSDPEFPQVSGFANYRLLIDPSPDPANPSGQYKVNIGWAEDGVSIGNVSPELQGMSIDFSGDDRNPVFTFTGPQMEFKPPGKASEPTLRAGDKSADGWVEYLQELLNLKGAKLEVDGAFGGETLKAVKAFQRKLKKEGVLEDGTVGDQTWSFLREGAPAKPKTDGRKAHSFVEKGNSARWVFETKMPIYYPDEDLALMQAISVGDVTEIAKRGVRFRFVAPNGVTKVFERPLGEPFENSKTGQGNRHNVAVRAFSTLFGPTAVPGKADPGQYKVTAYFPADLGGDTFEGTFTIAAP